LQQEAAQSGAIRLPCKYGLSKTADGNTVSKLTELDHKSQQVKATENDPAVSAKGTQLFLCGCTDLQFAQKPHTWQVTP